MALYSGIISPCCGQSFTEHDDIVVCPECGTPHHRSCYAKTGKCCNNLYHEKDFVWKSPVENAIQGYKAIEELQKDEISAMLQESENQLGEIIESIGLSRDAFSGKDSFEKRDIYGVSAREISSFQGGTYNPLSIERYRVISLSKSKISLNIFAGILRPFYQLYNRHRSAGFLLSFADFLLSVPGVLMLLLSRTNIFNSIDLPLFRNMSALQEIDKFLSAAGIILFILCSLFYDYFYLRWMTKRITEIRSKYASENLDRQYYSELTAAGKPSLAKMLLDYLIFSTLMAIILMVTLYLYAF